MAPNYSYSRNDSDSAAAYECGLKAYSVSESISQDIGAFSSQKNEWLFQGRNKEETFMSHVVGRQSNTTLTPA